MNQNVQAHSSAWVTFTYASFGCSLFTGYRCWRSSPPTFGAGGASTRVTAVRRRTRLRPA